VDGSSDDADPTKVKLDINLSSKDENSGDKLKR